MHPDLADPDETGSELLGIERRIERLVVDDELRKDRRQYRADGRSDLQISVRQHFDDPRHQTRTDVRSKRQRTVNAHCPQSRAAHDVVSHADAGWDEHDVARRRYSPSRPDGRIGPSSVTSGAVARIHREVGNVVRQVRGTVYVNLR